MATELQLANSALIKCGGRTISSLTDTVKEARTCNERFNDCRMAVLRAYPASFAITRAKLTIVDAVPAYEYSSAFDLPEDFIRVVELNEGEEQYQLEGGRILINADEVRLRYVWNYAGPQYPDPLWNEAFALNLAWEISYTLTQSGELRDRLWEDYSKMLKLARFVNSTEGARKAVSAEQFLDSRMTRGRFPRDPMT